MTVLCNMCGLPCSLEDNKEMTGEQLGGLINATVTGGYFSTPGNGNGALDDCTRYHFSLCEFCLDHIFSQFKIQVIVDDYMDGEILPWHSAEERVKKDDWRTFKDEFFKEAARRKAAREAR